MKTTTLGRRKEWEAAAVAVAAAAQEIKLIEMARLYGAPVCAKFTS